MTVLTWEQGKVSCYRFPCPITQGLKSVWTCPFQHLSAPQRLLPAFKRTTLPSSLTLQGTCGRTQQSALRLSVWICIRFQYGVKFWWHSWKSNVLEVKMLHGGGTFCLFSQVKFYSLIRYIPAFFSLLYIWYLLHVILQLWLQPSVKPGQVVFSGGGHVKACFTANSPAVKLISS